MIISDGSLRDIRPVAPFHERTRLDGCTYGLSAAGYDVRIAEDVILWPGRFTLASTVERFDMPDDVLGIVHDKSTWARRGIAVQNTVIEPGWTGYLTLELTMHAWRLTRIRAGVGIAQIVFHRLDHPAERPYNGKYQNQERGPQAARYEQDIA